MEDEKTLISELKLKEESILSILKKYGIKYIEDFERNEIAEKLYKDKKWEEIKTILESQGLKIKESKILVKNFNIPKKILLKLEELGVEYVEDVVNINKKLLEVRGIGKSKMEKFIKELENYGINIDNETGEFWDKYLEKEKSKLQENEKIAPVNIEVTEVIEKIKEGKNNENKSSWKEEYKVDIENSALKENLSIENCNLSDEKGVEK